MSSLSTNTIWICVTFWFFSSWIGSTLALAAQWLVWVKILYRLGYLPNSVIRLTKAHYSQIREYRWFLSHRRLLILYAWCLSTMGAAMAMEIALVGITRGPDHFFYNTILLALVAFVAAFISTVALFGTRQVFLVNLETGHWYRRDTG